MSSLVAAGRLEQDAGHLAALQATLDKQVNCVIAENE